MEQNFLPHPFFEKTGVSFRLLEPDNDPALILHQFALAVFFGAPAQLSHGDQRFDGAFQQGGSMAQPFHVMCYLAPQDLGPILAAPLHDPKLAHHDLG
jgi:hypothetical protein